MEAGGESPWEARQRETREECGLDVSHGELVCVDFLRPRPGRPGGMRFLFDCGTFSEDALSRITLQEEEISRFRLARIERALELLSGPVRRRVTAAIQNCRRMQYLENGLPVD
jgi:8-oxo-dGTP pyrophosphatase MutT (NUDIX family)